MIREELYLELEDYIESCKRTGNLCAKDNFNYFINENKHMELTQEEISYISEKLNKEFE